MYSGQAKPGFSLIEIIIALAIIGIMAGGAISMFNYVRKAKKTSTAMILRTVKTAIEEFHNDTGAYPSTLLDLVTRPSDEKIGKRWKGDYLPTADIPLDGYKHELQYQVTKGAAHPYELYSWGPEEGGPQEEWIDVWNI